jgi:hypothetical protein
MIPNLIPDKEYPVYVVGPNDKEFVGQLLVDEGQLSVDVDKIELHSGERIPITFRVGTPASASGLYLHTTTDIPDSIVMPEVLIPGGNDSVTVTVEGGSPGEGTLFVDAAGYESLEVPVEVSAEVLGSRLGSVDPSFNEIPDFSEDEDGFTK